MIKAHGPSSGLPCSVWAGTVVKSESKAKPDEVVKAWEAGSKAARNFLAKPEKKAEAKPEKQKPRSEKAGVANRDAKPLGLRKCDDLDLLHRDIDPNSMPPCQP